MMFSSITSLLALLLAISPITALSAEHSNAHRRHHDVAHRARGDISKRAQHNNIRATFYSAGMGACGIVNQGSDFIVALAQSTFGFSYPSDYCFKWIEISYGGKTAKAQITDSCPGCALHSDWGLDLTEGLFTFFAPASLGVIAVDWSFVDGGDGGGGNGGDDQTTKKHHTTPKPDPPKTTTHTHSSSTTPAPQVKKKTSSTTSHSKTTRSTTHSTTHSTTTKTTSKTSSTSSSSSSLSSHSPASTPTGNLQAMNQAVLSLEAILAVAAAN